MNGQEVTTSKYMYSHVYLVMNVGESRSLRGWCINVEASYYVAYTYILIDKIGPILISTARKAKYSCGNGDAGVKMLAQEHCIHYCNCSAYFVEERRNYRWDTWIILIDEDIPRLCPWISTLFTPFDWRAAVTFPKIWSAVRAKVSAKPSWAWMLATIGMNKWSQQCWKVHRKCAQEAPGKRVVFSDSRLNCRSFITDRLGASRQSINFSGISDMSRTGSKNSCLDAQRQSIVR